MKRSRLVISAVVALAFITVTPLFVVAEEEPSAAAIRQVKRMAKEGDPHWQNVLGGMYAEGNAVLPKDEAKALEWFQKSADKGDAEGQFRLGDIYARGKGVPQDYVEALKWFGLSIKKGYRNASTPFQIIAEKLTRDQIGEAKQRNEAFTAAKAERDKAFATAKAEERAQDLARFNTERTQAEKGNATAQNYVGLAYSIGKGTSTNDAEAVKWFRLSAEQGDAAGQALLGSAYANGKGVAQNYQEAIKWFRRSAEQGDSGGQQNLGLLYWKGRGVTQDFLEAYVWYTLAAVHSEDAAEVRDNIAEKLTPEHLASGQRRAREFIPKKRATPGVK